MRFARLAPAILLLSILVVPASTHAARQPAGSQSCVTCLGRNLELTSPLDHFPLDGFHRVHVSLRRFGRPEFLFIGVVNSEFTNAEQWPLVKALAQFGVWSGVRPVNDLCSQVSGPPGHPQTVTLCDVPTLDLSHALLRSRYLVFTHRYVASFDFRRFHRLQRLSPAQNALFRRYSCGSSKANCFGGRVTVHDPLQVIGSYVQTSSQFVQQPDFYLTAPAANPSGASYTLLSYAAVHDALVTARARQAPISSSTSTPRPISSPRSSAMPMAECRRRSAGARRSARYSNTCGDVRVLLMDLPR